MKTFVVWDADDVLFDLAPVAAKRMREQGANSPPASEWTHYRFNEYLNRGWEWNSPEIKQWMIDSRILEDCVPFSHTAAALRHTHELGYNNILITARGWHPDAWNITQSKLREFDLNHLIQRVFIVTPTDCKAQILQQSVGVEKIALFVEDSFPNAIKAHQSGIPVALVETPWNRSAEVPLETEGFNKFDHALSASRFLNTRSHWYN